MHGVALSEDGRLAVSASDDHTLKVWDVPSGRERRTLEGHSDSVIGVSVRRDGRLAVSASYDKTLKVWDVETGHELRTLQGHSAQVLGVALAEDGRLAVSAANDNTLKVWDVATGIEPRTLGGHKGCVHGVALSQDSRLAVSASFDNTLKVWEVDSWHERNRASVTGVCMCYCDVPARRRTTSACTESTVRRDSACGARSASIARESGRLCGSTRGQTRNGLWTLCMTCWPRGEPSAC